MSADNWRACPRCEARHEAKLRVEQAGIDADYGNVPVAEFDQRRADLEAERAKTFEETFREDWEIGVYEDAEFFVSYSGGCRECGLRHKFTHAETLDIGPATA